MRVTYDPDADALYILLRDAEPVASKDSIDVEPGVTIDRDAEGRIVGIEILNASRRLDADRLTHVDFERYPAVLRASA